MRLVVAILCVSNLSMIEELLDKSWLVLRASQVRACLSDHFLLIVRALFLGRAFNILIQIFPGIPIRARGRQWFGLNLPHTFVDPGLNSSPLMHRVAVVNQNHFAYRLAQQSSQELKQYLSREGSSEHHEAQVPLIGNGRDHVTAKPLSRTRNDGGLPAASLVAPDRS